MSLRAELLKVADVVLARPLCVALGGALRAGRGLRRAVPGPAAPERILVIRPGGIGDAVLFIPMLQELRRAWPRATIDLLAERRNAGVLDGTGLVGDVQCYDDVPRGLWRVLRRRYDLVIDTEQYHCLSAIVAALTRAPRRIGFGTNARRHVLTSGVGYSQDTYEVRSFLDLARAATGREPQWNPDQPFYPLSALARADAARMLAPLAGRPLVAIHPGASIPERRWPVERYAALASALAGEGVGIVILGGAGDRDAADAIAAAVAAAPHVNLAGRTRLALAAAVIAQVSAYVSADTGLLHLAYAVGTPTVHLFGPGVLAKWGPPGQKFTTLAANVPCSPCTIYGYTPPCCQGMACMRDISAERVTAAVLARVFGARAEGAR